MDAARLPHNFCLDLALKILNQLPTIPLDLLYPTLIPMMIACVPESYVYETGVGCKSLLPLDKETHMGG